MNVIPRITNPLGACWKQPRLSEIEIDETHALMSEQSISKLSDYSHSMPSGVYVGKMWKCKARDGWLLRWYGECELKDHVSNNQRKILLA